MLPMPSSTNLSSDASVLSVTRATGRLQRLASAVASATPFYQQLSAESPASSEQLLIKLLQRHRHETGWIVLVAPTHLPSKALAKYLQLPTDKIMIIHANAIKNLATTLHQLLHAISCRVVINFSDAISEQLTQQLSQCAASQQRWLYQFSPRTTQAH
ncbi:MULTISPECIES: hypothetical protein [unclassified Arsukibacterium]|uniref:hypothetical protein n=1 Tax=unclassified Arsukibacterium TaxID=2635278 RepID=UPI000C52216A|nr:MULTISPECIES: hypothetical protein [unclassified Arsukibacterium]MAA94763.1 hypothetical protein [Rheinheimera sp.]MBM33879.1 hypothetical protein [Rheinheimera sp.]HAW91852.1 hypothetical protein [Candidatus Azambacteria bacterium]|tara:strand:+ start:384 stop:857 length:474 start_codon:yes stop_codon:yes gene_type:complete